MAKGNRQTPDERQRIEQHRKYAGTLPKVRQHRSLPGQRFFEFDRAPESTNRRDETEAAKPNGERSV